MVGPIGPHIGFMFLGGIAMLLFWGGIAVLIVFAVRWFALRPPGTVPQPPGGPAAMTPRQLLDDRLVKGEISVEEYEKIKAALEG